MRGLILNLASTICLLLLNLTVIENTKYKSNEISHTLNTQAIQAFNVVFLATRTTFPRTALFPRNAHLAPKYYPSTTQQPH